MRPLRFRDAREWQAVKETQGWDVAGRPPPGVRVDMPAAPPPPSRGWSRGPVPPVGPTKAERTRSRRVRVILAKHGIGQRGTALGWRI